jgi:hypothetical protein
MLLILDSDDKPRTSDDVNLMVSAELPDENIHPLAYETVKTCMIHGPCKDKDGNTIPGAACMVNGKCTKGYPKKFRSETSFGENDSYPQYRRRDDGRNIDTASGASITNEWVVPHNLYLSTKYNAHINVEICSSVSSIKYIYKYVYKGHDRAIMEVSSSASSNNAANGEQQARNEIKEFVEGRYISAPEAFWRIFSFSMHEEYPAHQRLAIHLENENVVVFEDDDDPEEVVGDAPPDSTLTGWFKYNANNTDGNGILYPDFPLQYVWDKPGKFWKIRKERHGGTIGRIYAISPRDEEKYFLRMLLYHVPGAKSYAHIRTIDGHEWNTYKEAATALGLLSDDDEWDKCLNEAASFRSPSQLRKIFEVILLFCQPMDPYGLWEKYKEAMSEDYIHRINTEPQLSALTIDDAYGVCILDISDSLEMNGLRLFNYSRFVRPADDKRSMFTRLAEFNASPRLIREQLEYVSRATDLPDPALLNFNSDQRRVFDSIMATVNGAARGDIAVDIAPKLFFVDGPGGTGKTFLFNAMINAVRRSGGIALCVASSGTAAVLLDGGRTAHSRFKIPLDVHGESVCNIKPRSDIAELLRLTKLIVWDECSMISRFMLEAVDRTFRDIFKTISPALENAPFGARTIVFGGDFRQVLPVIPKGKRSDVVNQCINRSRIWSSARKFSLTINMRVQQAQTENNADLARILQDFSDQLIRIGDGTEPTLGDTDKIRLPNEWCLAADSTIVLSDWVFGDITDTSIRPLDRNLNWLSTKAILTPKNKDVNKINNFLLEKFPGIDADVREYISSDVAITEESQLEYPVELLNSIECGGIPDHKLKLKLGCPVILLRNLDAERGLRNGTRLVIRSFRQHLIEATIATGAFANTNVLIPRITVIPTDTQSPVPFKRRQFPLRLAFCMTINKSQGQTLDRMGLFLPEPVFSHGQLYVALSRVKSPTSIKVLTTDCSTSMNTPTPANIYTNNVVYTEVFQ